MSPTGVRLLLIEDDVPTRRAVAAFLEKHQYRVDEAGDARDALRRWDANRADLVVLDLGLPDLDGVEIVRRIPPRRDDADRHPLGSRRREGQGGGARGRRR